MKSTVLDEHGRKDWIRPVRHTPLALVTWAGFATFLCVAGAVAQTPAHGAAPQGPTAGTTPPTTVRAQRPAATPTIDANLLQLMRGIVYPSSNVIFAAQGDHENPPGR
jgi:hypothetical protein